MLDNIRKKSSSTGFKIFLSVLALSFIAWGASDYFIGSGQTEALRVNGEAVSIYDLDRAYRDRVLALQQQYGDTVKREHLAAMGVNRSTVDSLVRDTLLLQDAQKLDLRVSDNQLAETIRTVPQFQNSSGAFDPILYKNFLSSRSYTVEGFENALRRDMNRAQLDNLFGAVPVDDETVRYLAKQENETLDVEVLHISEGDVKNIASPSEEELRNYYELNRATFIQPEKRVLTILSITPEALAQNISKDDASVRAYFAANSDRFKTVEKRKARHILLEDLSTANRVHDKLSNGASFAALAQEHSIDSLSAENGGDLGEFIYTDMVEQFSQAAFSLEKGQFSEPVQTPFGYHIIEVTAITPARLPDYATIKADVLQAYIEEETAKAFDDALQVADTMIIEGKNATDIAKELGIKARTLTATEKEDALSEALRSEAFMLAEGDTSDPIMDRESASLITVNKVDDSRALSLDEVKKEITQLLMRQNKERAVAARANQVLEKRLKGASAESISREFGLHKAVENLTRIKRNRQNVPSWMGNRTLAQVIATPAEHTLENIVATDGGYAVVTVKARQMREPSQKQIEEMRTALAEKARTDLLMQYIMQMRQHASVKANLPLMRQVLGSDFNM